MWTSAFAPGALIKPKTATQSEPSGAAVIALGGPAPNPLAIELSAYSVTVEPGTSRPIERVSSFVYQTAPSAPTATSVMPSPVNEPEQGDAATHGPRYSVYSLPEAVPMPIAGVAVVGLGEPRLAVGRDRDALRLRVVAQRVQRRPAGLQREVDVLGEARAPALTRAIRLPA